MTSKVLRRRLHNGDVDGRSHEHLETTEFDGLNEPLLGDYKSENGNPEGHTAGDLWDNEERKDSFHRLLHKKDGTRAEWEYPFAVAGVNISFMLAQMLDLQSGNLNSSIGIRFLELLEKDEKAFDKLYCVAFKMIDAQWLAKRASYMDFNEVLKSTRTQLERELALEDVSSVMDLPAYNLL